MQYLIYHELNNYSNYSYDDTNNDNIVGKCIKN